MHEVCGSIPLNGSFSLGENSHIVHAQLVKMFYLRGGGGGRCARVAQWALTSYQYGPGSNPFINTINNMVDEELLCGPYGTSKSWVWVSEILLYFIYFFIFLFTFNILVTDHVNRRCGKNNGRDTGRHWISKSMYNYLDQGVDTEDEPQQDLCKNLLVSHPIFFYLLSKIKSHLHFSADSYDSLH